MDDPEDAFGTGYEITRYGTGLQALLDGAVESAGSLQTACIVSDQDALAVDRGLLRSIAGVAADRAADGFLSQGSAEPVCRRSLPASRHADRANLSRQR